MEFRRKIKQGWRQTGNNYILELAGGKWTENDQGKKWPKYKEDDDRAMLGKSKRSFDEENHVR